jgi:Asp-tRNA(Asn)/Glu-tRNA(Gln) amidotransferase A subunit family amidase
MDRQSEDRDQVRKLRLPSGKQIEVVVFGSPLRPTADEPVHREVADAPDRRLHLCRACGSNLVHPIDWEEVASDDWRLELRCPNCEWTGEAVYERRVVEELDEELERGMETIVRDLRHMTQANMQEHVERFVTALDRDFIVPFDF